MSEVLFQIGMTKLALSLGLATAALLVQKRLDRPPISHALWTLVLVTLLVPALVPVRVPVPGVAVVDAAAAVGLPIGAAGTAGGGAGGRLIGAVPGAVQAGLVLVWLIGAGSLLLWSLFRAARFHRLLSAATVPASRRLQRLADRTAARIGLREVPAIRTSAANLSPMVWWIGGRVRVLIPARLVSAMDESGLRWILAHELAHVKRRDHVTRWLEWLACVAFWWNPVVWWTRRELRSAEEFCCDDLVLSAMNGSPRAYGSSLVSVIDHLSTPATARPPAFASAMDSGGRTYLIERRLRKIMKRSPIPATSPPMRAALAIGGLAALCLGLINCGADADALAPEIEETAVTAVEKSDLADRQNVFFRETFDHSEQMGEAACSDCLLDARAELTARKIRAAAAGIREKLAAGTITGEEADAYFGELKSRVGADWSPADREESQSTKRAPGSNGEEPKVKLGQMTRSPGN